MKIRAGLVLLCVCLTLASAPIKADAARVEQSPELAEFQARYVDPLGSTTVIWQQWYSPEELNPDSVLTVFQFRAMRNEALRDRYYNNMTQMFHFPQQDVEAYSSRYFGMTPDMVRKAGCYDPDSQAYLMEPGMNGTEGVEVYLVGQDKDILYIHYYLVNALDETVGDGMLKIQTYETGGYRYQYNRINDAKYS